MQLNEYLLKHTEVKSKVQFVWEFVLNSKAHKVELFQSKISGKKKLCVDSRILYQDQQRKNNLSHSFKIDSSYFNIVQVDDDEYDLRIDNRSFAILMQEEKWGRLKTEENLMKKTPEPVSYPKQEEKKFEQFPSYLRTKGSTRDNDAFYSNEDTNFYAVQNQIKPAKTTEVKVNNNTNNTNANANTNSNTTTIQLLDLEIQMPTVDEKSIKTTQTFNHNKSILSNLNFFENDNQTKVSMPQSNMNYSNGNNQGMNFGFPSNNNQINENNNNYQVTNNSTVELSKDNNSLNIFNTSNTSNVNMNMNQGIINPSSYTPYSYNQPQPQIQYQPQPQLFLQPQSMHQQPQSQSQQQDFFIQSNSQPQSQYIIQDQLQQPITHLEPQSYQPFNNQSKSEPIEEVVIKAQPSIQYQHNNNTKTNALKTKIMTSGLVNLDNLLEHHIPSGFQKGDNYNFDNSFKGSQDYYTQNSNLNMNSNQNYDFNSQLQPNAYELHPQSNNYNHYEEKTPFDF